MPLLFCDGFGHYNNLVPKWDFPFNGVIVNGIARTGTQCCRVTNGSAGPAKILGQQQVATYYDHLLQGVALNVVGIPTNSEIMNFTLVAPASVAVNISLRLNTDGSISVIRGAGDGPAVTLATSAAGLFTFTADTTQWNYIECKWKGHASNGFVEVRLAPPGQPMSTIITLTGVKTVSFSSAPVANLIQLSINAGINNGYFADYYLLDWSDPTLPDSDYLGGVKIFYSVPFADGSPVQWTPLAGANWQEVSEVPPDDDSSYNVASTVGLLDAYQHNTTGLPANSTIMAVQHIMDVRTDAGSRAIRSVVNGVPHANSVYIGGNYAMFTYQYDLNPATAAAWKGADFPSTFGPEVTA